MKGTHQLLVYADNLLVENILKKETEALLVTSKKVGLEVNTSTPQKYVHVL
jgi:hypothetical protein